MLDAVIQPAAPLPERDPPGAWLPGVLLGATAAIFLGGAVVGLAGAVVDGAGADALVAFIASHCH